MNIHKVISKTKERAEVVMFDNNHYRTLHIHKHGKVWNYLKEYRRVKNGLIPIYAPLKGVTL